MEIKLTDSVTVLPYISDGYSKRLTKLGIETVKDLLTYFPYRYTENTNLKTLKELKESPNEEDRYLIRVQVRGLKNIFTRRKGFTIQEGIGFDNTGEIQLSWFNQKFIPETLKPGFEYLLSGRIKIKGNKVVFFPDNYEQIKENSDIVHLRDFAPEYSLTAGVAKKWLRNRIQYLIKNLSKVEIKDELSEYNYNLIDSLEKIHFPEDIEDVESAIKVLSAYELTNIQLQLIEKRRSRKIPPAPKFNRKDSLEILNTTMQNLPFELTEDQQMVLNSLVNKMLNGELVDSMIQGDVGSGKTIIAVLLSLITARSGYQAVILAPTTILAEQHFNNFQKYIGGNIKIELVTSKTKNTAADILIGTTAILSRQSTLISNPGLIVIDEQHKFGVNQREELLSEYSELYSNSFFPHFLNMSATPIPRSVVEFVFGEVEVEYIKSKPKSKASIQTRLIEESKRNDLINWVKEKLKNDERVYWVVPAIESEESGLKNIPKMKEELLNHFQESEFSILHGKMKDTEKTKIMAKFSSGETKLLLSTSVIEVGIDVPQATVIVIENPEQFGLAQLHQIRGRVGRGSVDSWCFLQVLDKMSEIQIEKLSTFSNTSDGMEISEYDLKNRGPGEIYGTKQSGVPNLKIADFSNFEAMTNTKEIAKKLYNNKIKSIEIFS